MTLETNTVTTAAPRNGAAIKPLAPSLSAETRERATSAPVRASENKPSADNSGVNANAAHDRLLRRRDQHGNRLPHSYAASVPVTRQAAVRQTELDAALDVIGAVQPGMAAHLRDEHERKLLYAGERFQEVLDEESRRHLERNTGIVKQNANIDAQQEELAARRDEATHKERAALIGLDAPLTGALQRAGEAVARTGGKHDSTNPEDATCVLRHARRDLKNIAADLRLPMAHVDESIHLEKGISWLLTVLVGALIGVSLGIMAHALHPDTLAKQWPVTFVCAVIGFAVSVGIKFGVRYAWYVTSRDYYLPATTLKWMSMGTLAGLLSLLLLMGDLAVERAGLLSLQLIMQGTASLNGAARNTNLAEILTLWFAPILVTLGYLVCAGYEGAIKGQHEAVLNRLLLRQEQDYQEEDTRRRDLPEVQEALHAIADVGEIRCRQAALADRIGVLAAPFEAKIVGLESLRRLPDDDLSLEARRRIQDALDNYHYAQEKFDRMFADALDGAEPFGGWWQRLWRGLFGYRRVKSILSETRQKPR